MIKNIFKSRNSHFFIDSKNKNYVDYEKKPIFIVGMPRSGTTLVEQIISSHSSVYGGGELNILSEITSDILKNNYSKNPHKLSKSLF